MKTRSDILSSAQFSLPGQWQLVMKKNITVNTAIRFSLHRFSGQELSSVEDNAVIIYHPKQSQKKVSQAVELKYCLAESRYCATQNCQGDLCNNINNDCLAAQPALNIISLYFSPAFFEEAMAGENFQWPLANIAGAPLTKNFCLCPKIKFVLQQLLHHEYSDWRRKIFLQSKAMELLLLAINCSDDEKDISPACRFLSKAEDREKIMQARDIMLLQLDNPVTIRELSRKIAMNECYLKKGFKEIFGTTIYDYFQKERMSRAKYLLFEKGLSVSEVALMMGYSCISHFSTAFKKHTGLKPCELLK